VKGKFEEILITIILLIGILMIVMHWK